MTEAATQRILEELEYVKEKITEIDNELHSFHEEFSDTHLSEEERKALAEALEEEHEGKTITLAEVHRHLNGA